jgi:hypothetical protein
VTGEGNVSGGPGKPRHSGARTGPDGTAERPGPPDAPAPRAEEHLFYCDLCGSVMLNLHCKLICERCGYKRDCSDP